MAGHEVRREGGPSAPAENPRTSRGADPMIILRRIASASLEIRCLRFWTCSFENNGLSIARTIEAFRVPGAARWHGDSLGSRRAVGSGAALPASRCWRDPAAHPIRHGNGPCRASWARRHAAIGAAALGRRAHQPLGPLDMIGRKLCGVREFRRLIGHGPASYDVLDSRAGFGGQIRRGRCPPRAADLDAGAAPAPSAAPRGEG